ncbi:hypothetical protein ACFSSA_09285 [Luteolibacter algae]|uniref:Uncharacterized protein n=1 Tax=Luteolibacter algae TaxID=454151 RepID=A0ABW5D731_9BACT
MIRSEPHEYAAGRSSSWMGATEEGESITGHDLRGGVGEGFGEASPVEWGRAHEVGRGESHFPIEARQYFSLTKSVTW